MRVQPPAPAALLIKSGEIAVDAGAANIVVAKNVFGRIESVICALRRQGEADCSPALRRCQSRARGQGQAGGGHKTAREKTSRKRSPANPTRPRRKLVSECGVDLVRHSALRRRQRPGHGLPWLGRGPLPWV